MWGIAFMLWMRRLLLAYCIFVLVLVWMLRRAKRIRDVNDRGPDTPDASHEDD